jgi:hypothetical protein
MALGEDVEGAVGESELKLRVARVEIGGGSVILTLEAAAIAGAGSRARRVRRERSEDRLRLSPN